MSRPARLHTEARPPGAPSRVFLNVPYDAKYEPLFVALVGGLVALGRQPTCGLEVAEGGRGRLQHLLDLIRSSDLSIHDLSRVQTAKGVPRFNMPFELGLCCAAAAITGNHPFYVFEEKRYRLQRSLSDLNLLDPRAHGGTQLGILRELLNCLGTGRAATPPLDELHRMVRRLSTAARKLERENRARSLFEPRVFRQLLDASTRLAVEAGFIRA